MNKINFSRILSVIMAIITMIGCMSTTPVYAAGEENSAVIEAENANIGSANQPKSGVETLPLGWYTISDAFTIDDYNYTPVKTVQGRYMKLKFASRVNLSLDSHATTTVLVTIKLRDYYTGAFIPGAEYSYTMPLVDVLWQTPRETSTFDLGYAGRKVQIYTKISSYNSTDTSTRVVDFHNYQSYVSN